MKCVVCQVNETEGTNNYCSQCFKTRIDELDRRYGKKEGPSSSSQGIGEAQQKRSVKKAPIRFTLP